jgi:hypothetical protein
MRSGRRGESVVQPLPRHKRIPPTQCEPMRAAPSLAWSVFKPICADHWQPFQHAHPRYQPSYYEGLVTQMLAWGNPENLGYLAYRCLHGGQGKHLVAMSGQSSLG